MPRLWAIALACIVMCLGMAPASFARPDGARGAVVAVSVRAPAVNCGCVAMGLPYNACGRCDQVPPASMTSAAAKQARLPCVVEAPAPLLVIAGSALPCARVARYDAIALAPPERPPQHV